MSFTKRSYPNTHRSVILSFVNQFHTPEYKWKLNFLVLPFNDFFAAVEKAAVATAKGIMSEMKERVLRQ